MLTSLLPGLRDLRSPLAAGYMLLLALWLLVEEHVPDRTAADGVIEALYRLGDLFSVIGVGITVSFVAYLVGSLSAFAFNPALRWILRTRPNTSRFLDTLSDDSRAAIAILARDTVLRLRATLSLSGHDVDDVVDQSAAPSKMMRYEGPKRWWTRLAILARDAVLRLRATWTRSRRDLDFPDGPGHALPEGEPSAKWEAILQHRLRGDIEIVAQTRLLGEKPDLFMAIDRKQAEVEFRLAVAPPLVLLALAAAVRQNNAVASGAIVALGLIVASAIFFDAVHQQREANELVIDLLSTSVVKAPAVERMEDRARVLAEEDQLAFRGVAERTDQAVKQALRDLRDVGKSEPSLAWEAERSAGEARRASETFRNEFPDPSPFQALERAVSLLECAAEAWVAFNKGEVVADPRETAASARGAHLQWVREVRESLSRLTQRPPPGEAKQE